MLQTRAACTRAKPERSTAGHATSNENRILDVCCHTKALALGTSESLAPEHQSRRPRRPPGAAQSPPQQRLPGSRRKESNALYKGSVGLGIRWSCLTAEPDNGLTVIGSEEQVRTTLLHKGGFGAQSTVSAAMYDACCGTSVG